MITSIQIENFKIHKSTSLQLSLLNVLTGMNSSGKSSVIQALLLLRQNYLKGDLFDGLQLNGDLCNIGLIDDAICQYSDNDNIHFAFTESNGVLYDWVFQRENNSSNKDMFSLGGQSLGEFPLDNISLFSKNFQYISASRWEPKESYPLNTNAVELKNQISLERGMCELVVHYLYHYGKEKQLQINPELKYPGVDSLDLLDQVSAWESAISTGVNVLPQMVGKAFVLKYSYNRNGDFVSSNEYNATNVGFGLSYALPIIVALLTAKKGSLLLIENPEIHLHPQGQAELARLIALASQSGIQIMVETHSDHIINGILVATKMFENQEKRGIDKEHVKLYYFQKDENTQIATYENIRIVGDGKIDLQPDGFFTQTEKDLKYLLGF